MERPKATWLLYASASGEQVVSKEIHKLLEGGPPLKELGALMSRIQFGTHLPRDIGSLGKGLHEARLSHTGIGYRLYYARGPQEEHILLGLAFHKKGGQGAQDRVIALARKRPADWLRRI
ncbi:hypothetical protein [Streptosporangium sp. NPDC002721]|uniref:hypothetical protein n=1 Tax=Streptosporangium sp. NPDC002721 TaxID=3366188 RepID=UPI00369707D6